MTVNKCWGLLRFPTPPAWFFPSPGGSLPPLGTPPSATITTQPWLMVLPMLELLSHHAEVDLEDEKHSELAAGRARLAPPHGITGTDLCQGLFWVRKAGFEGWCSHARYHCHHHDRHFLSPSSPGTGHSPVWLCHRRNGQGSLTTVVKSQAGGSDSSPLLSRVATHPWAWPQVPRCGDGSTRG